jgi:hypothetical protein
MATRAVAAEKLQDGNEDCAGVVVDCFNARHCYVYALVCGLGRERKVNESLSGAHRRLHTCRVRR